MLNKYSSIFRFESILINILIFKHYILIFISPNLLKEITLAPP